MFSCWGGDSQQGVPWENENIVRIFHHELSKGVGFHGRSQDVFESVSDEKKLIIENDEIWKEPIKTMSDVIVFLHRHDTFKRSLDTFNNDNIRLISDLHHRLMNPSAVSNSKDGIDFEGNFDKYNLERISHSYRTIMDRFGYFDT